VNAFRVGICCRRKGRLRYAVGITQTTAATGEMQESESFAMSHSQDDEAITVRPARAEEVPVLTEFIRPFVEEKTILPRTAEELQTLAPNGFVAEYRGEIVGFAALEIYSPKLAEIRSLAVAESAQGRGVGKRLVDACVRRAHERNILEVMAISSAENFFRSCGFDFTLPAEKKAFFLQTRKE